MALTTLHTYEKQTIVRIYGGLHPRTSRPLSPATPACTPHFTHQAAPYLKSHHTTLPCQIVSSTSRRVSSFLGPATCLCYLPLLPAPVICLCYVVLPATSSGGLPTISCRKSACYVQQGPAFYSWSETSLLLPAGGLLVWVQAKSSPSEVQGKDSSLCPSLQSEPSPGPRPQSETKPGSSPQSKSSPGTSPRSEPSPGPSFQCDSSPVP